MSDAKDVAAADEASGGFFSSLGDVFGAIVVTMDRYPVASFFACLFLLLLWLFRGGGFAHRWLSYLEEKGRQEALKEDRRLELVKMFRKRIDKQTSGDEPLLPGLDEEGPKK